MSKEGNSYQNPIRFYSSSGVLLWEKGKKAFDNQVPGKYADDPINGNTYVCTSSKTLNAPQLDLSAGIAVFFNHVPFTWRYKSS